MISLILSIFCATIILIIFKAIEKYKVDIFAPIVINYIIATILGSIVSGNLNTISFDTIAPWSIFSVIIGILLIGNFFIMGHSTQKAGIAITTISAKMSFIIPMIYSLAFDINDIFSLKKLLLISLALLSIFLIISPNENSRQIKGNVLFPFILFIGIGALDALVKYCQYTFIHTPESSAIFSTVNFMIAGIIGVLVIIFNKSSKKALTDYKAWLLGVGLGVVNYGSMYFLINALNALKYDNSLVFGINNIGVVTISVIVAILLFKEHFSKIKWIGFSIAILVLVGMISIFI